MVLEEPVLAFGEGELLLPVHLQQMLVFGQLQDEFERLTHAVLHQLLLRLLQTAELLDQLPHHPAPYILTGLCCQPQFDFLQRTARMLDQIADHLP